MSTEELVNIAGVIYKNYTKEELKNYERPRLINNITFTKYNEALRLDPLSMEAFIITGLINDYIIISYYQDTIKYSRPTNEYIDDKESYVIFGDEVNGYVVEDHRKDDLQVKKLV